MLTFLNKQIYLDFELFDSYNSGVIMFCDNVFVSTPLPQEKLFKTIDINQLQKIQNPAIIMNVGQFIAFIKEWYKHSKSTLETNIDIDEWIKDYFSCIKTMSNLLDDVEDCGYEYMSRDSLFRERQKWLIDNLDLETIEPSESPIIFNSLVDGEYSWKVADYFNCKLSMIESEYSPEIEDIVQINKCKCIEYQRRANIFNNTYLNFNSFNNFNSMDDICYLYFPLSRESISSNFIYIKKVLKRYLEKKC